MKRARRSFLRSAGGVLLAAAVPAAISPTGRPLNPSPPLDLLDIAVPPEWSFRMHLAEWTGCFADIQSICMDGATPLAEDIPTIMHQHLEGRGRVVRHDSQGATDDPAIHMKLKFVRYGANGHMLLMDVNHIEGYRIVVLPGDRVSASKLWLDAGMSFEEWVSRALLGAWLNDFPMNVDSADLICALAHTEESKNDERAICAISLGRILRGNTRAAMHEAQYDATQTLLRMGYPWVDGFFITFHGPHMDETFVELCSERFAEIADDQTCILGQDWDDTLPSPFVSVIAHGVRSPRRQR